MNLSIVCNRIFATKMCHRWNTLCTKWKKRRDNRIARAHFSSVISSSWQIDKVEKKSLSENNSVVVVVSYKEQFQRNVGEKKIHHYYYFYLELSERDANVCVHEKPLPPKNGMVLVRRLLVACYCCLCSMVVPLSFVLFFLSCNRNSLRRVRKI